MPIKKVSRGQKINQRPNLKRLPAYVSRKSISSFESYQTQLVTIRNVLLHDRRFTIGTRTMNHRDVRAHCSGTKDYAIRKIIIY